MTATIAPTNDVGRSTYYSEPFTQRERELLQPFVTNLDRPVFALTGLPQVTAAALFARYSRSNKSLRRLLLDEFLANEAALTVNTYGAGTAKARDLFARVLTEYGDDSVAQLAGVHIACEQVSQPLAKAIEWGRLASYLEQSTRYIMYADQRDGRYRYHLDPSVAGSPLAEPYVAAMDGLFNTYRNLLAPLNDHLLQTLKPENDDKAWRRAVRALALDVLRGILPAGTVSNVGVFGSPQALEQLVLRLRAHPLPEAREYAKLVGQELRAVVPDFVTRLDREDRGQVWAEYLAETAIGLAGEARELSLPASTFNDAEPVKLLDWTRDGEDRIIASSLFPFSEANYADLLAQVSMMSDGRRDKLFATAVGQRRNRRHRPGRGFEHSEYTFEIVSDYGAFRDLQRHRLLTIQWQRLTPSLGYAVPDVITEAGLSAVWIAAIDRAEEAYRLIEDTFPEQAQYLVTLGHKLRYMIKVNAREAMHLIELRTSPQGHASYRQICQRMHDLIAVEAKHPLVAGAMSFVGRDDVHLPRYSDERRRATATQLRLPIS